MRPRNSGLALAILAALASPAFPALVLAQGEVPAVAPPTVRTSPELLLSYRERLALTPAQVDRLSDQDRQFRWEQKLTQLSSKPWNRRAFEVTPEQAQRQALAVLTEDQRDQARRLGIAPPEQAGCR